MKHNKLYCIFNRAAILLAIGFVGVISACNSKDDDVTTGSTDYVASQSVAITAFNLQPDLKVMKNLDSVYFSIDLEHGVIFNADSLPKGTNITKLVPKLTYPSTVTSAKIEMSGGSHREGTVDYIKNPTDTIDFTGNVTITLATSKNELSKTYRVMVNVHKEDPDTLYWDRFATMNLPSRQPNPKAQKSVKTETAIVTLIQENDGTYTLASNQDIFNKEWERQQLSLGFTPNIETLRAASDGTLYILSESGDLMSSSDGMNWSKLDSGWNSIIGPFGEIMLGTRLQGQKLTQTSWPSGAVEEITMPEGFPLSKFTVPVEFSNRWSYNPTIVVFGGYPYQDNGKSPSWAFDGSQWVDISENALPALSGLSVVRYYSYLKSASNSLLKEFEVLLAFGGRMPSGEVNRTVYISYDHGINWQKAQEYSQLPANIGTGYMVDAISEGKPMQSNLSDRWKVASRNMIRRLPFEISGDMVKWNCPYIFLLGGYDQNGNLNQEIRGGVLQRLTFTPLF